MNSKKESTDLLNLKQCFPSAFTSNVRRVFKASNVSNTYPECVHEALKTLLMKGESQFSEFWNSRLTRCEIPINHKIMKNVLSIPGRYEKNQKESEKRLVYPVTVLTKLRSSIDFRSTLSKETFKTKLFRVSQSLAKTSIELYHSKKSDVLSVFTTCDMLLTGLSAAVIIGLSFDLALALYSRI